MEILLKEEQRTRRRERKANLNSCCLPRPGPFLTRSLAYRRDTKELALGRVFTAKAHLY